MIVHLHIDALFPVAEGRDGGKYLLEAGTRVLEAQNRCETVRASMLPTQLSVQTMHYGDFGLRKRKINLATPFYLETLLQRKQQSHVSWPETHKHTRDRQSSSAVLFVCVAACTAASKCRALSL